MDANSGAFSWTPDYDQAGDHPVTFQVSDGVLTDEELITITVTNINTAPVLTAIGSQTVDENATLAFTISATDAEDDALTYSSVDLPGGSTLDANSGAFSWTPNYDQAGDHPVTFQVSDGDLTDEEVVTITVYDINRAPVLTTVGDQTVDENSQLTFILSGTDPDGDALTYSATNLPAGATLDGADFSWTPDYDQAGPYVVTFEVTDGGLSDDEIITINVNDVNRAPAWTSIPDVFTENESLLIAFTVTGIDADGDGITISMAQDGLPIEAQFTDNGDGTGDFSWQTTYDDAGDYYPIFTLSDGAVDIDFTVLVSVIDVNRAPVWVSVPDSTVLNEGDLIAFEVTGTDPDGDPLTITLDSGGIPDGYVFADSSDGTASFSWQTAVGDTGAYTPTFTLSDGNLTAVDTVPITVLTSPNQPPVWTTVPDSINAYAGDLIAFTVTGTDPNNDTLAISFDPDGIPEGYVFADSSNGTASFSWQTVAADTGYYTATFTIGDGDLTEVAVVPIRVVPLPNVMFVGAIDMSPIIVNRNQTKGSSVVTILDNSETGVVGAIVSVTWSGLWDESLQDTTDGSGQVYFETGNVRLPNGYFFLTVTDVVLNGWTYDEGLNVETVDSLGVGDYTAGSGDKIMLNEESIPEFVMLDPAFPNPFNDQTSIRFGLPEASDVSIEIYDLFGRSMNRLSTGNYSAGYHTVVWNAKYVPAGVYLIRMQSGTFESIRKVSLIR